MPVASITNFYSTTLSYGSNPATIVDFLDLLVKILVTGLPPLNAEKITVTNKVARVITTEKNFYVPSGIKLQIGGTNNNEIDGRREVTNVFPDGFEFETDANDGVFTNDLTYSSASFGWTLISKTAVKLVLKSGSKATVPFYVIFEEVGGAFMQSIAFNYENLNYSGVERFPLGVSGRGLIHYSSIIGQDTLTYLGNVTLHRFKFFVYGDDSFFVLSCDFSNSARNAEGRKSDLSIGTISGIGEMVSKEPGAPKWVVSGFATSNVLSLNHYYIYSYVNGLLLNGNITTDNYTQVAYRTPTGNLVSFPCYSSRLLSGTYTGVKKPNTTGYISKRNRIVQNELVNVDKFYVGEVPGSYLLENYIEGCDNKSITPFNFIDEKGIKKRGILISVSGSALTNYNSSNVGYALLDLSGPIR